MHKLKSIKDSLICQAHAQMEHLECVDAKELGEVIDMIKDVEEAMYYHTIVEAMEGKGKEHQEWGNSSAHQNEWRHPYEGRSPMCRKTYMEAKEMHHDKAKKMKELENYMQELTVDIAEMIEDSSPEERQLIHKKISALASKIEAL